MALIAWYYAIIHFFQGRSSRRNAVSKKDGSLRFGILGAATIAPTALIFPARTHSEVIIAAVAARDKKKAEAYAKQYDIPIVHDDYESLINDHSIDCIYNPLPNGLHYEWTLKALKAGKHVLLEKPSVSNTDEAESLFRHSLHYQNNAPVLLEASHYRFHPVWSTLRSLFDPKDIQEVDARCGFPVGGFDRNDIRFHYDLAGGATMDLGHYTISAVRSIFGTEPIEVETAAPRIVPQGDDERCEDAMVATYRFPNGGTGHISVDLRARGWSIFPWLTKNWPNFTKDLPPWCSIKLREENHGNLNGLDSCSQTTYVLNNFMGPHLGHKLETIRTTYCRDYEGNMIDKKEHKESKEVYVWPESSGLEVKGDKSWSTYRYMLEEFVNRVKKRKGSGIWIDGEDSIKNMQMTDKTYEKAEMLKRPSCTTLDQSQS